ncbi:MAG: hypothetical protein V2A69_15990 [Pseudomonadota bacterium]
MSPNEIIDKKLRALIIALDEYLKLLQAGREEYRLVKMEDFLKDIVNAFEDYIKNRRREAKKEGKKYDVKNMDNFFDFEERNLISTFARNAQRAFGQATFSIEKTLKQNLTNPGFFGLFALKRIVKKDYKPKGGEPFAEGISRVTKTGNLFSINLVDYLILLIRTAQAEYSRKVGESVAYEAKVDLVRIDPHPCWLGPRANEVCNRWRDRIISLTGMIVGFPKLSDATSEKPPLFHPNCTHSMHPLTREEQRIAIEKRIMFYTQLKRFI